MTKSEMEKAIIEATKTTQHEEYGNYSFVISIKEMISKVMFDKYIYSGTIYHFGNGCGKGKHHTSTYKVQLITDEQLTKVEIVFKRLVDKGYLKISKSGEMAKLVKEF